jgi:putative transposase
MTAPHIVDPAGLLGEALAEASPDLMRHLLQSIINSLLSADADAVVGAEYGRPSPGRVAQRNGYRHRPLDTRVGTIDVAIPKLRQGTYFPHWLLERRKRAEAALITVVADCYLAGVSTRRMDKLVKTLGIDSLSKSQVSRMAAELDQIVEEFRHRPLGAAGPFTFVAADALTMKVREGGRVVNAVVLIATGVNGDGHREVLGLRVATSKPVRRGTSSSPTSSPAACPGSPWSPPTLTPGWSRPSRRTCPARPGNAAAPTTPPTS